MTMSVAEVRAYLIADGKLLATGLIIAVVILAFDLLTPLGVAGGVPYVILVLLCLWAKHRVSPYVMAGSLRSWITVNVLIRGIIASSCINAAR